MLDGERVILNRYGLHILGRNGRLPEYEYGIWGIEVRSPFVVGGRIDCGLGDRIDCGLGELLP